MTTIELHFPGKPQSAVRPRAGRHGFYNPKAGEQYRISREAREQYDGLPLSTPLVFKLIAVFERPKKLKGVQYVHHDKTPDASNIVKLYEDALNGIVYDDDKRIVHLEVTKWTSDGEQEPGVWIEISDDIS